MTVDETTGTPEQEGGDAGESTQTTGTPATEGRDAASDITANAEQVSAWKAAAEERNRLKEEVEQLRREREQPPGAPAPQQIDQDWAVVTQAAAEGNEYARTQVRLAQALMLSQQQNIERDRVNAMLDDIEDPIERRAVRKRYQEGQGKIGVEQAQSEFRMKKLEADLAAANARLKQHEEKTSPRDAVRLPQREQPASEIKARQMTQEQWDRDQAALDESDDPADHKKKMALQMARRRGEITVKR